MCERFEQTFGDGTVKIDRKCLTKQACGNSALGPYDQACNEEMKNDEATKVCRTCDYGAEGARCDKDSQ